MISKFKVKDNTVQFQTFVLSHYLMHKDTQAFINGENITQLAKQYVRSDVMKTTHALLGYKIYNGLYGFMIIFVVLNFIMNIRNPTLRLFNLIALLLTDIAFIVSCIDDLVRSRPSKKQIVDWNILRLHLKPRSSKKHNYIFFTDDNEKKIVFSQFESQSRKEQLQTNVVRTPKRVEYMLVTRDAILCFDPDLKLIFGGSLHYLDKLKKHVAVKYLDVMPMCSLKDIEER